MLFSCYLHASSIKTNGKLVHRLYFTLLQQCLLQATVVNYLVEFSLTGTMDIISIFWKPCSANC